MSEQTGQPTPSKGAREWDTQVVNCIKQMSAAYERYNLADDEPTITRQALTIDGLAQAVRRIVAAANGWRVRERSLAWPLTGKDQSNLLARVTPATRANSSAPDYLDHIELFELDDSLCTIIGHPYLGDDESTWGRISSKDRGLLASIASSVRCHVTVPAAASWHYPNWAVPIIFSEQPLIYVPGGVAWACTQR